MLIGKGKLVLAVLFIVFIAVYMFLWQEARKEIFYLCGNFSRGDNLTSVTAQLQTGHYLNYDLIEKPTGTKLVATSKLPLQNYQCSIVFDKYQAVNKAWFE